jgi:NADH-quinone oxidoreductase subunit H
MTDIVLGQGKGWFAERGLTFLSWNWLPLLPIFAVYVISGIAETNRAPFDVVEGESEIVAGHMVEYSGMAFAMFFLAEYANILLVSALAAVMFLGGWMAPVSFAVLGLQTPEWIVATAWFWNWFWLFAKIFVIATLFLWVRATFPRFRYDQIMRLGWKIFIPVTLVWLVVVGLVIQSPWNIWK